ncbi:hypothetical protein VTK73DRAFT_2153 [Phialemonium thermophilum]|uniref:DUF7924 domain-containing protein n=1 Tax=Phialemonium thermophilum TaxID=223376 RepID=A0ABR3VSI7_9PEZI
MSNGICIRHSRARLPSDVARSVEEIRADRGSPGLSARQMDEYLDGLGALAEGCTEADVEEFFRGLVFPELLDPTYGSLAGLGCADSALLPLHLVPDDPESRFVVSQPRPSLLYGFSKDPRDGAFTPAHVSIVESLHPRGASPSPAFPFLAILFKAVGGTQGDLWVATDQCAGASAACLNAVDLLNKQLRDRGSEGVGSICFSVAMDNNVAQLYVSWKEGDAKYWVQRVDDFLLSNPDHFTSLRSRVRNILDWAKRTHLEKIRRALDVLEQTGRHG